MRPLTRLVAAGLLAGVASGAPSGVAGLAGHGDPLGATREIGRRATGRRSAALGGLAHLGLSVAFAAAAPALRRTRMPLPAGAAYGLCLYLVDFRVVAPRAWPEILRWDGPLQVADNVAYGLALVAADRMLSGGAGGRRRPPAARGRRSARR
jgi:hypothetical protein